MSKAITRPQALAIARQHHRAGRLAQAEAIYRSALRKAPDDAEILTLLGAIAAGQGRAAAAIEHLSRAVQADPRNPAAQFNLGKALLNEGRFEDSLAALRAAGARNAALPGLHTAMAAALCGARQFDESLRHARLAVAAQPESVEALTQLGVTLREMDRLDESISALSQAAAQSASADVWSNLGVALRAAGKLEDSIAAYRKALDIDPQRPRTHWNLAIALLTQGRYAEGFAEYEWRWKRTDFARALPQLPARRWDGAPVAGQTLLLVCEQGFGDSIQFIRFAADASRRAGKIIVACPAPLTKLLARAAGVAETVPLGEKLPPFHTHCPLMTLPHLLGVTLERIPAREGHLKPDPEIESVWRKRMAPDGRLRVGLCWAGRPTHQEDRHRSIDPELLLPLAELKNIRWFSLQKESPRPDEEAALRTALALEDPMPLVDDFDQAAGLVSQLDAVVTIDSAIAHLAGAMGKPTFILLPSVCDWRWLRDRSDSPWYASARLCRQERMGDWSAAVDAAVEGILRGPLGRR